jgi:hypothetical protein
MLQLQSSETLEYYTCARRFFGPAIAARIWCYSDDYYSGAWRIYANARRLGITGGMEKKGESAV